MAQLKQILLVAGRYLSENPYREVRIKRLLEAKGIAVTFAIPGHAINKTGFTAQMRHNPVFKKENTLWIEGDWDYQIALRRCQGVVLSTWRSYDALAIQARNAGLPTINFTATSGQDHWPNDVDHCLVRSTMAIRLLEYLGRTNQIIGNVPASQMTIVGSLLHEPLDGPDTLPTLDKESFCQRYGLDPSKRTVVLFPAGIAPYRIKLSKWHPDWSQAQVEEYIRKMVEEYLAICTGVADARCNLLIKLHPAAYASYWCREGEEAAFWHHKVAAKILHPDDTRTMFHHMDIGVGINTNASMDTGYFNKPFIYLSPEAVPFAPTLVDRYELEACCGIPLGPSTLWHTQPQTSPTPWMTSWLGDFCTTQELPERLQNPQIYHLDPVQKQAYIQEFWYRNDGLTGVRIADAIIERLESALAHAPLPVKLRRLRHALTPGHLASRLRNL
ncbi:MAG: hypothetical protein HQL07_01900 [Nitrospirae bacterium]|nr:hypothetical protein [Magnetococcales bacterium]HAT49270.1 hypothetical protein [Alphaproteobacteria bacterium]